ncbi:MAG: hypothetical protein WAT39_21965 [Planctomycetota bacterium]
MFHLRSALASLLLASLTAAQITATWDTFGTGCTGTGTGLGGRTILPAAAATTWGGGNAIPLGWNPNRYQQVFLGSELPTAFTLAGLSLRQPHTGPTAVHFTIDVEMRVGYTTRWGAGLSPTFATNWDAGAPVTVLPRQLVNLPDQPTPPPNPTDVLVTIRWNNTFDWVPQPGRNLLIEITVFGNSVGGAIYGYPIDNLSGTYSLWATPATATTGSLRSFGPVMSFDALTHAAVPELYSDDTPQINNTFRVRIRQAAPSTILALLLGWSDSWWLGNPLPFQLAPFGAPGCALLAEAALTDLLLTDSAGATNLQYTLPFAISALGSSFYSQAFVYDPAANAFGFVTTNGGHGVFGNQ